MFLDFFFFNKNLLLLFLLLMPLFFIFILFFLDKYDVILLKIFTLWSTLIIFFFSIFLWIFFNNFFLGFQFSIYLNWFFLNNINFSLGIDGISILFIILTTFLFPFCILISWNSINFRLKEYLISLLFIEFFLLGIFCSLDIFMFYIFFESILLPMFLLIGVWGSRNRKVHAAYQFFLYTLLGSILMLLGILLIYFHIGTTDIQVFLNSFFSFKRQLIIWITFFISFGVKVPMIPVHIWLPEAHVEAPTAGSVLLAGVLLKLGTYGVLRFLIPVLSEANFYFTPLIFTLGLIGVIYGSCTTIRQIDLKKIIAYSSVAHMNFALIGLFTPNFQGLSGSIFLMLSHGIVSGALFLCVGLLYDRYHTRILKYYGGLITYMPFFGFFF